MNKSLQHLFFDLDRTLWDFESNSRKTLEKLHEEFQLDKKIAFDAFYYRYKRINKKLWQDYRNGKIAQQTLRNKRFSDTLISFDIPADTLGQKLGEAYVSRSPRQTQLFDGTKQILDYLHERYTLHILTNGFTEVQHIKLENCGIDHYFDQVICSEGIGKQKPDIQLFQHSAQTVSASENMIAMIGDDFEADIKGALNAGWEAIWFNPRSIKRRRKIHQISELLELKELL